MTRWPMWQRNGGRCGRCRARRAEHPASRNGLPTRWLPGDRSGSSYPTITWSWPRRSLAVPARPVPGPAARRAPAPGRRRRHRGQPSCPGGPRSGRAQVLGARAVVAAARRGDRRRPPFLCGWPRGDAAGPGLTEAPHGLFISAHDVLMATPVVSPGAADSAAARLPDRRKELMPVPGRLAGRPGGNPRRNGRRDGRDQLPRSGRCLLQRDDRQFGPARTGRGPAERRADTARWCRPDRVHRGGSRR